MKTTEYIEIESITEIGVEDVFDISMSGDMPSFVANEIVVHNCGMRKLLKDLACLAPLTFEEISAATALYRPGPIDAGLVDRFVAVKQGKASVTYDHPLCEPALRNTYGVLVYQEQIMQVCRDLAGFTMTEADGVRKAMGKKDADKMATYKDQFVAGAMAGQIEVEMEDGTTVVVHRNKKFKVLEGGDFIIEEIFSRNLTLAGTI